MQMGRVRRNNVELGTECAHIVQSEIVDRASTGCPQEKGVIADEREPRSDGGKERSVRRQWRGDVIRVQNPFLWGAGCRQWPALHGAAFSDHAEQELQGEQL